MSAEVGEVIRAVAEGARGGMQSLRAEGFVVGVDAFDVEVDYVGRPGADAGEVCATLRLRLDVRPAVAPDPALHGVPA